MAVLDAVSAVGAVLLVVGMVGYFVGKILRRKKR